MSQEWDYQIRLDLSDEGAELARTDRSNAAIRPLFEILASTTPPCTINSTLSPIMSPRRRETASSNYPLYKWTKATIENPEKKAKYIALLLALCRRRGSLSQGRGGRARGRAGAAGRRRLVTKLAKYDSNPANNPQAAGASALTRPPSRGRRSELGALVGSGSLTRPIREVATRRGSSYSYPYRRVQVFVRSRKMMSLRLSRRGNCRFCRLRRQRRRAERLRREPADRRQRSAAAIIEREGRRNLRRQPQRARSARGLCRRQHVRLDPVERPAGRVSQAVLLPQASHASGSAASRTAPGYVAAVITGSKFTCSLKLGLQMAGHGDRPARGGRLRSAESTRRSPLRKCCRARSTAPGSPFPFRATPSPPLPRRRRFRRPTSSFDPQVLLIARFF